MQKVKSAGLMKPAQFSDKSKNQNFNFLGLFLVAVVIKITTNVGSD